MTEPEPGSTTPSLRQLNLGGRRRESFRVPGAVRMFTGPALLLLIWLLVTATGWVSSSTFPTIPDVIDIGRRLIDRGQLQSALWASLKRVLLGLGIGVLSGLTLAVLSGTFRRGQDVIDSTMQVIKAVPTFALIPLLIIWLGIYEGPKVTLIALSSGWPIYFNTFGGIRNVDARLVDVGHTLGLRRLGLIRHVIVPGALPGFLVGLRISLANAWLALVVAEEINANDGLGRLLSDARTAARLDTIVLIIVVYALLGMLSYGLVKLLEARLLQWRRGFEAS
jgi:sulfonate transport system permease protein